MTSMIFGSGPTIRGFSPSDMYTLTLAPKQQTGAMGGATAPLHDFIATTPSGTAHNVFQCLLADSLAYPGATLINKTPAIVGNVAPGATATWLADGTATVQVHHPFLGDQFWNFPVSSTGAFNLFTRYANVAAGDAADSLAYLLSMAIDIQVSARLWSATTVNAFNATDHYSYAAPNLSLWCASLVNLSGIPFGGYSPGGGYGIPLFSGALISPNHMLSCNHAQQAIGNLLYFWGSDNAVHTAKILATGNVPGTDIQIYYLGNAAGGVAINSAVDTTKVRPFSVLPTNFAAPTGTSYLASLGQGATFISGYSYVPMMYYNQYQEVLLMEIQSFPTTGECSFSGCSEVAPINRAPWSQSPSAVAAGRAPYTYGPIGGDSGSPCFTVMSNDATKTPVLLGTWHTGNALQPGAGTLPNVTAYNSQIQSLMRSLALANSSGTDTTPYSLSVANLSAFPLYS